MNLVFVTIHVTNLDRSIQFYQDVIGMELKQRFPAGPDQEIAFLASGGAEVELITHKDLTSLSHDNHLSIAFQVDSLEDAMKMVEEKGVKIESGPFEPNPKSRFFFIQDPSGVTVQLIEQH